MIKIERRHFGVLSPSTHSTVEIEYTRHVPAAWGVLGIMKPNDPVPGMGRLPEQMPR